MHDEQCQTLDDKTKQTPANAQKLNGQQSYQHHLFVCSPWQSQLMQLDITRSSADADKPTRCI